MEFFTKFTKSDFMSKSKKSKKEALEALLIKREKYAKRLDKSKNDFLALKEKLEKTEKKIIKLQPFAELEEAGKNLRTLDPEEKDVMEEMRKIMPFFSFSELLQAFQEQDTEKILLYSKALTEARERRRPFG